jgi:CSLREA domain-containing protein
VSESVVVGAACVVLALFLAAAAAAKTYKPTTTKDHAPGKCNKSDCTLREAITAANGQFGADVIAFDIPGGGIHTITPGSALPAITEPVLIDGSTQPGTAGSPLIVLDGSTAGAGSVGLSASASDVTIRGLRITGFDGAGGNSNTLSGNSAFTTSWMKPVNDDQLSSGWASESTRWNVKFGKRFSRSRK